MSKGKEIKYRIRKREKVPLTYNDSGPYETRVKEYEVSYNEWLTVLKNEARAKEGGYARPDVWTVPE